MAEYGKRANEAEKNEQFEVAYGHYMQALDIFMHLIKCKAYFVNILRREKLATGQGLQRKDGLIHATSGIHQENCFRQAKGKYLK